jgi:hypothetical protein
LHEFQNCDFPRDGDPGKQSVLVIQIL